MLTAQRIETTLLPEKVLYLGDESYYYNYDIKSYTRESTSLSEKIEETVYSFIQVRLYGKANYNDIVKAVIREYVDSDQEFDLINSANRVALGLSDDEEATKEYKEYLDLLDTIKATVKADLS